MRKYIFLILTILALFACDPAKYKGDLPKGIIFTESIKKYEINSEITAENIINDVIKNETYIQFIGGNKDSLTFEILSELDTKTEGKKKIEFKALDKKGNFSNLYLYIFIFSDLTQNFPNPSETPITDVSFSESIIYSAEDSFALNPICIPENTNQRDFIYSSSDESIATVSSDGVVTKIKLNEVVTLTLVSYYNPNVKTTVQIQFGKPITAVNFANPLITSEEDTITLQPIFTPADTTQTELIYSSSDTAIATVDNAGLVTKVAEGKKVTITVLSSYNSAVTAQVDVYFGAYRPITAVNFVQTSPIRTLENSVDLNLSLTPANTSDIVFDWTSSNEAIATVSNSGEVLRVRDGKVSITATNRNKPSISATIDIKLDMLAENSLVLSGLPVVGLNKTYTKILAADFEGPGIDPNVDSPNQSVFSGYFSSGSGELKVLVNKTNITNWRYIEFRIRSTVDPNIWFRGETDDSNCGGPVSILRFAPNSTWGAGWSGSLLTNYNCNGNFYIIGFLYSEGTNGYFLNDRQYVSSAVNCDSFIKGLMDHSKFRFTISGGSSVSDVEIDYIGFYN